METDGSHGVNTPLAGPGSQPRLATMNICSLANAICGVGDTGIPSAPHLQSIPNPGRSPQARSTDEAGCASKLPTVTLLPDPAVCHARFAGFANYADCLVEHSYQCPHALNFAGGFLCRHPHRDEIVRRTARRDCAAAE